MTMINKDYIYTKVWEDLNKVDLTPKSLYLYASDPEDRSKFCAHILAANNPDTTFIEVEANDQDQMKIVGKEELISLSSTNDIKEFLITHNPTIIYIEVTGMSCRLVAPLMRCSIENAMEVRVIYSEPKQYLLPEFRKEGVNEDLSEACG